MHPPRIDEAVANGEKVMVHCGGGKGRAGTIAACAIMRFGVQAVADAMAAEHERGSLHLCTKQSIEVTRYLRVARPGSMETMQQERCLREFALSFGSSR